LRKFRARQHLAQARAPRRLEGQQFVVEPLQAHCRHQLRRIGNDAASLELGIEGFDHAVLGDVQQSVRHKRKRAAG